MRRILFAVVNETPAYAQGLSKTNGMAIEDFPLEYKFCCLFSFAVLSQCIYVAGVCMLCLKYPVQWHDIAWSNARTARTLLDDVLSLVS